MQRHEILAWLDDNHGLTDDQLDEFTAIADEIEQQYPDPDEYDEAQAALTAAYRLMVEGEPDHLVVELASTRTAARIAEAKAVAGLRQIARQSIGAGGHTEAGFARLARVDRMTVRSWRGK